MAANGFLEYINNDETKVTIEKVAIYIKDSYDFDKNEDEYLGDWNFKENEIEINPFGITSSDFVALENEDYRNYRIELNKGYTYNLYTTIREIDKFYEFKL